MNYVDTPQSLCQFAIARVDITPPVGIYHRMWGAATHDRSEGVHRPLTATAMLFQSISGGDLPTHEQPPENYQVLIALDHCLLGAAEIGQLLKAICHVSRVQREAVAVTFSHTHAAGLMLLDRASLPGGELIPDYLEQLGQRIGALVAQCSETLQVATITYGQGHCNLATHRDFWDEASGQYVCGFDPTTPADDTLMVARVSRGDGRLIASLVNYACHPTTLAWQNRRISPDYPGAMREVVETASGAPCVFLQGACGELGPRDGYVGDPEVADRNGRQLGYAAAATLQSLPPPATRLEYVGPVVSGATVGTWSHRPWPHQRRRQASQWKVYRSQLPLKYRCGLPTSQRVESELAKWSAMEEAAQAAGDHQQAKACRAMVERQTRLRSRIATLPAGESFPYQIVLWRLGDAVWLAVQGEPYNVLQMQLRARFADVPLIVASICGDWGPAYLPPAELYGRGIYQESIAVLDAGCLEQLIEELGRKIQEFVAHEGEVEGSPEGQC